ncbi:DUF2690 domain-containing protein [Streptomyces echinoruber]|uniref:DUF2690 domain-containing protein n=1 Tax=Streptomyces echinoruber TaxID=68898 RepID=A0A918QYV6_9ACTN|nr:DUF2690 domain-containing protein [Streptomyces echinoruber]GGZ79221.1 hypothetical protein GCM10010389_16040 [Streptomyces echinoruber]
MALLRTLRTGAAVAGTLLALLVPLGGTSHAAVRATCSTTGCDNLDPIDTGCAGTSATVPQGTVSAYDGQLELRWSSTCRTNWARFSPGYNYNGHYAIWVDRQGAPGVGAKTGRHFEFWGRPEDGPFWSDQLYAPGPARACVAKENGGVWDRSTCTPWL